MTQTWGPKERATTAWAVLRLQWWLEWYGAPSGVCRPMRQELAANLRDAHEDGPGLADGVRSLGDLRELAREAASDHQRFRWERGLTVGVLLFAVLMLVQLALVLTFADGLLAAGGGTGDLLGGGVTATEDADALTVSAELSLLPLVGGVMAFVLVSRPWRYRRDRTPSVTAA